MREETRHGKPGYLSRRGRWHSRAWWFGHHDARDRIGEYTETDNLGGPPHGRRAWRSSHPMPERRGKARTEREQLRDDLRLAKHAQDRRAEQHAMGYKAETAAFYGSAKHAAAEHVERRHRVVDADDELRRYRRQQRETSWYFRDRKRAS